jgi:cyclopropane fatty-acyl-phospholipid synthase-like methyltransferase
VGLKPSFTILDTDDQLRLLKQLIQARNIDDKRWPPRMLAGLIDGWKNRALTPDRVPSVDGAAYNNLGTELYAEYQDRLRSLNACDFGDLLLHCVTIFKAHPDVLAQYQRWFRTSWSTNTRTPTSASISGCGCWRRRTATSAASATTTSRSMAGAGPRSATSCGSKRIFPARR